MTTMQATQQSQGVGSPMSNRAYDLIAALQAKLEGMEAYRKYAQNGNGDLWRRLTELDTQAVQMLTEQLEQAVQQGELRQRAPGQTR